MKGKFMLNCKDYEKMIPDFLADKLDAKTAEKFIGHIEKCPECMEEVSIQYLIILIVIYFSHLRVIPHGFPWYGFLCKSGR